MPKWRVKQTLAFYWDVDAQSEKEAIEIADDMGEINTTSHKYTQKTARLIEAPANKAVEKSKRKIIHASDDELETLCGITIPYEIRMGIKMPSTIISLDTAISGNASHITCRKCQNIMYR